MRISVLVSSVLAAALLAVSANAAADPKSDAASAPKQTTAKTREQSWIAQCSSASRSAAPDCAVNKRVVLANTGQLLAAITVRIPSKTRKPMMMLQAPLGIHLSEGISLTVGKGKPHKVALETCENNGCYAAQPMPADLLKKFQAGGKLLMSFQNLGGQDIKITISLDGFAEAYEKVK